MRKSALYEVRVIRNGEESTQYRQYTYLTSVHNALKFSDVRGHIPHLEIIAKREKLTLTRFSHFEMAYEMLKYQISWN